MISNEAVNHAIDYILQHLNEDVSVDDVAAQCHFSKYYFNRIFKEETGESIYAFIKRLRLEQSAFRLKAEPKRTITDIGYAFGYSPSNYSWTFRGQYQTSPIDFRRKIKQESIQHPFYHDTLIHMDSLKACRQKITVKTIPDYFVIYERRIGSYHHLSSQWHNFINRYQEYVTEKTLFLERTFDDPAITNLDGCLYDICMSVDQSCPLPNTCVIHGGKCAVYPYKGLGKHIYAAYQTLFTVWLPQTDYMLDDRCGFDIYRKIDNDSGYMELDICLPLRN
ncbi:MAG: AraC family transcriptional regulator [Lachnospiraceae bacterium]|nr:AraC family transcriptional regulator [Lachnospiraceae bacterium]MDE7287123.1 AraC family transcriptional regulator [Lachnospiraceae bacterium]